MRSRRRSTSTATTPTRPQIRSLARLLYERVDWAWMLDGGDTLRHGWRPESGFLPYRWSGYDEALILYVLALGSPTHPIAAALLRGLVQHLPVEGDLRHRLPVCGAALHPPDVAHLVRLPRHPRRATCASTTATTSRTAAGRRLVQQQYAIRNPLGFKHVSDRCWGITASDGPGDHVEGRSTACSAPSTTTSPAAFPYGPDDGTIAPWAVAASIPFAPEIVAPTIAHMKALHIKVPNPYGFKASFNPVFGGDVDAVGWVSPYHFGINEGPTVIMIENHRSGMIWSLMRRCAALRTGPANAPASKAAG